MLTHVDLEEAKKNARVYYDVEDLLIDGYIVAAQEMVQNFLGVDLQDYFDEYGASTLPEVIITMMKLIVGSFIVERKISDSDDLMPLMWRLIGPYRGGW